MNAPANDDTLALRCPAKLNLTLAVAAPREDGLHPIASVMVALDFGDDLRLRRLGAGPSSFSRRFADDAPKPQPIDWPIERDLMFRAHEALEQQVGRALPVACEIEKRIPAGAGLGGGSSDAAAMLVGLRRLFDLKLHDDQLVELARQIGADVVFLVRAILGQPAALVTGIGDVITPIRNIPPFDCVLVFPDSACPTAAVYQAFDTLNPNSTIPQHASEQWTTTKAVPDPYNDLLDAAIRVCPAIASAMQAIRNHDIEPRLTGSGSALFAILQSQGDGVVIANTIRNAGLAACPTRYSALSCYV